MTNTISKKESPTTRPPRKPRTKPTPQQQEVKNATFRLSAELSALGLNVGHMRVRMMLARTLGYENAEVMRADQAGRFTALKANVAESDVQDRPVTEPESANEKPLPRAHGVPWPYTLDWNDWPIKVTDGGWTWSTQNTTYRMPTPGGDRTFTLFQTSRHTDRTRDESSLLALSGPGRTPLLHHLAGQSAGRTLLIVGDPLQEKPEEDLRSEAAEQADHSLVTAVLEGAPDTGDTSRWLKEMLERHGPFEALFVDEPASRALLADLTPMAGDLNRLGVHSVTFVVGTPEADWSTASLRKVSQIQVLSGTTGWPGMSGSFSTLYGLLRAWKRQVGVPLHTTLVLSAAHTGPDQGAFHHDDLLPVPQALGETESFDLFGTHGDFRAPGKRAGNHTPEVFADFLADMIHASLAALGESPADVSRSRLEAVLLRTLQIHAGPGQTLTFENLNNSPLQGSLHPFQQRRLRAVFTAPQDSNPPPVFASVLPAWPDAGSRLHWSVTHLKPAQQGVAAFAAAMHLVYDLLVHPERSGSLVIDKSVTLTLQQKDVLRDWARQVQPAERLVVEGLD